MAFSELLDLKSVPCPLNVVKIKLALEKLPFGGELIVHLVKGEPQEMVQNTLKEMGYYFVQIGDDHNSIQIKIFNDN